MDGTARTNIDETGKSRRLFLATLTGATALAAVDATAATPMGLELLVATEAVTPFTLKIPGTAIDDLKLRLRMARLPEKETIDDWSQGAPLGSVQALLTHWRDAYDMHRLEERLNA